MKGFYRAIFYKELDSEKCLYTHEKLEITENHLSKLLKIHYVSNSLLRTRNFSIRRASALNCV